MALHFPLSLAPPARLGICRVSDSLPAFKPWPVTIGQRETKRNLEAELTSKNRDLLLSKRDGARRWLTSLQVCLKSAETKWVRPRGHCGGWVKRDGGEGRPRDFPSLARFSFQTYFCPCSELIFCGIPELFRGGRPSEWGISYYTNRVVLARVGMLVRVIKQRAGSHLGMDAKSISEAAAESRIHPFAWLGQVYLASQQRPPPDAALAAGVAVAVFSFICPYGC